MKMSSTTNSTPNTDQQQSKLQIFQHNCNRVTNTMHSVLESAVGKIDIVLFQEPWIGPGNITVSHPAFTSIIPVTELRPRVVTFISKANCNIKCTPRPDISTDSDLQALSVSMPNLKEFLLLNIYNEKSLQENSSEYTVERALSQIRPLQRTLLCGDLNAHHSWWNSRISQAKNSNSLINWLERNQLELINTPDIATYTRNMVNGKYTSVLDLVFATGQMATEIIDWQINENEYSGSDHEVIQFSITTEDIELVESPFNAPFNIQKANWMEFKQQLVHESEPKLIELRQLETQRLNQEQMEKIACSLRDLITKAAEQNIPRRKPCSRSKVWWNPNLTLLRKEMAKQSRIYKRYDQSQQQWLKFTSCRTEYFYAIKTAKRNSWTKFLSEAKGKEVFQAYKYTKPRLMEKIPPIQDSDGKLCQNFNDKCYTFIKAMYPKPPEISQDIDISNTQEEAQWNSLTNNEVKQAIFTSSPKKAAGPDEIGFAIIQEAYKAIAEVMNLTYKILIKNGFHPQCWREGTGVILKKQGKPDYSLPKAYRIITLLNCLGKVAEKIMATRLSYLSQISDLLDTDQTGGRKQRSAIDAVMALTHDIELAWNQKDTLSCLLLDVKGAFDHVSTKQLLRIMSELHLPTQVQTWTKSFLEKRKAGLAFDGEKQRIQDIEIGIPQGSPISPVLFLIYIRFLFPKIKAKFPEVQKPSYIDDVALYTTGKNAEENAKVLQEVAKTVFTWAEENAVQFDDSKSELIHFSRGQKDPTAKITLPNRTVIKPVNQVKWLGIWLDRKLTFKTHVHKKASDATRVLHLIHRLMNSEWGLSAQAGKQLYTACITSISDYGSEIWWKNQRNYEDLLQKLQNTALRKILGAFRTSPGAAMEIEANIEPVKVRLNKKCRKYALRVTTLPENHCIRQRTPMSYPPESSSGQEIPIQLNYLDWNQNVQRKGQKHPTQLIRILNSISTLIPSGTKMDSQSTANPPWQNTFTELADLNISEEDRETVVKRHLIQIRQLIDQNFPIFYTDGSKLEGNINSQVKPSLGAGIYWVYNNHTSSESHFLGHTQEIMDAEIYAISQAIERIVESTTRKKHFWIFTDSQSAIQSLQKDKTETEVYQNMKLLLEAVKTQGRKVHIHWIPSHTFIPGNELADMAAKKGARNAEADTEMIINSGKTSISRSYIKKDIAKIAKEEWIQYLGNANQGQQYSKFQTNLELKMKSKELNQADRLTFTTFTQIKLGHGYFKSYLVRLPAYENNLCHICKVKQTPEHILMSCKQYKAEQKHLKNAVLKTKTGPGPGPGPRPGPGPGSGANMDLSLKRLLCTGEGIRATLAFLKETKIATRKWMLGEVNEELEWGSIDREV